MPFDAYDDPPLSPFDPSGVGTNVGNEGPPFGQEDLGNAPWPPDSGDEGWSDIFNPWGDQDLGEWWQTSGPGGSGGAGGGIGSLLKKLFGGKNKGDAAMQALALLAGLLGGGLLNRGNLAGSDEIKALLAGQKRRMDLQDPLFSAATKTAFSLLPVASRQGLSIGQLTPSGSGRGTTRPFPPVDRDVRRDLRSPSANIDEGGEAGTATSLERLRLKGGSR